MITFHQNSKLFTMMLVCSHFVYDLRHHLSPSLTPAQHSCLEGLLLPYLSSALRLFAQWAEEGWYDFCSLPFVVKMQMSLPDEDVMKNIPNHYQGLFSNL